MLVVLPWAMQNLRSYVSVYFFKFSSKSCRNLFLSE